MLAIISAFDDGSKNVDKKLVGFVHVVASEESSIRQEMSETALNFARKNNLKKVYLLYGEKGKIVYEYSN